MPEFWVGISISIAGGLGAVLRLILGSWRGKLAWGTLSANLIAGLVLGIAMFLGNRNLVDTLVVALLFSGFAGGLSTFSGVAAETGELIRAKKGLLAGANLFANLLLPVLAVYLPPLLLTLLIN